jgi:hypothetical protein
MNVLPNDEERELWRVGDVQCVMLSCCSGAELQVRLAARVLLRELYPDKSDLYDRARELREEYERNARSPAGR